MGTCAPWWAGGRVPGVHLLSTSVCAGVYVSDTQNRCTSPTGYFPGSRAVCVCSHILNTQLLPESLLCFQLCLSMCPCQANPHAHTHTHTHIPSGYLCGSVQRFACLIGYPRASLCPHCYGRLGVCEGYGYTCVNAGAELPGLSPIIVQPCDCGQVPHPLSGSVFPAVKCSCIQKKPAQVSKTN